MSNSDPVDKVVSNSDPRELSAEITKFAITNASKDPSTLEAAVCITAHNFVDEDGDDALNFVAVVGGNPNHIADLLIEAMNTLVDGRPLLAIKFHEALTAHIRDKAKAIKTRAENKGIDEALENVLSAMKSLRDSVKK